MSAFSASDDRGFSLIEVLVAATLSTLLGAIMLTGVVRSLGVTAEATTRVETLSDLQRVAERITRNVRVADPLLVATPTQVRMTAYDDVTRRVIEYTHTGASVSQTITIFANHTTGVASSSSTTTIIDGLDQGAAPVFSFLTANGSTWATPAPIPAIARVEVHLRGSVDRGTPISITSSAFLRNTLD